MKTQESPSVLVQETIDLLMNEGRGEACDATRDRFNDEEMLPPFYDKEKFLRGQQFYHKHLFPMLFGKLLGLMAIISTPNILKILIFTQMSGQPMTAFKRYVATILHMCIWYEADFQPGSRLWRSIALVKKMHNSASNRYCTANGRRILQRDMGITQFGFIGFILIRSEMIGIHDASRQELEGFVHLWRVVGYILGMDDRYNICRDSLEETKQVCEALVEKTLVPNIKQQNPKYLKMADALVTGMQAFEPILNTKTFMSYLIRLLNHNLNSNHEKLAEPQLNYWERLLLAIMTFVVHHLLKYNPVKTFFNLKQQLCFWFINNFPFIGIYKYGLKNSYISTYID